MFIIYSLQLCFIPNKFTAECQSEPSAGLRAGYKCSSVCLHWLIVTDPSLRIDRAERLLRLLTSPYDSGRLPLINEKTLAENILNHWFAIVKLEMGNTVYLTLAYDWSEDLVAIVTAQHNGMSSMTKLNFNIYIYICDCWSVMKLFIMERVSRISTLLFRTGKFAVRFPLEQMFTDEHQCCPSQQQFRDGVITKWFYPERQWYQG